ncbi:TauD/TfdA family dioxygenase [Pseudoruegeria sp. HB172150]|uniref:TauD/TfdA family dioxygenase n=1 Tax=Pseudoruegeria sp. HB172150 TaxID=2721164 RepID=UPI0015522720|nr:TauD/TfdA family dioxygenase [Pseudoruegeria sp. HB172150]
MPQSASIAPDGLHLARTGAADAVYPLIWLRHNCPTAFHPETEERILDLRDLPENPVLACAELIGDRLSLNWADGHSSAFELDWLLSHVPGEAVPDPARVERVFWRGDLGADGIRRYTAEDILASDQALVAWMKDTASYGLTIVEGVADRVEAGPEIARRVGFLRETNFGTTFAVRTIPNPNNLAYTAEALPLHTDLPNQELPPGYQFLHCLANEAVGGGSIFVDGFAVAADVEAEAPEDYALLSRTPVPFRFHDSTADIRSHRPVIDLFPDGRLREITHSGHLVDVFDMAPEAMTAFYPAFRRWLARLDDPAYGVTLKLKGGEMVVFDNRRTLHGRTRFDPNTGFRHLHGFYVDRQEFDSRLRVLSRGNGPAASSG